MSYLLDPMPVLHGRALRRLWAAVLLATCVYCEISQLSENRSGTHLTITVLWNVKVWTVWVAASVAFVTERGRAIVVNAWQRPLVRIATLVLLPTLALGYEWITGGWFDSAGLLDREASVGGLLYKRLPLYAVAMPIMAFVAQRLAAASGIERVPPVSAATVEPSITVQSSRGPVELTVPEIEAVIAAENYVEFCLVDGRQYLHRATLTSIGRELPSEALVRVHRSVIVNRQNVSARLAHQRLRLRSGRVVRIGRAYRDAL
jgi:hypothetical protein